MKRDLTPPQFLSKHFKDAERRIDERLLQSLRIALADDEVLDVTRQWLAEHRAVIIIAEKAITALRDCY